MSTVLSRSTIAANTPEVTIGSWIASLVRHWQRIACGSRRIVYALLLLVIGASVALSAVMEHTATAIGRNAAPLLNSAIPQLRGLNDFESALLRYQLALDKRTTGSITPERFQMLETMGRRWPPCMTATGALSR